MADPQLVAYVRSNLQKGYALEQVRQRLRDAGYDAAQINEAIQAAQSSEPVQPDKPSTTTKWVIFGAILTIIAIIAVAAVVMLTGRTSILTEAPPASPVPLPLETVPETTPAPETAATPASPSPTGAFAGIACDGQTRLIRDIPSGQELMLFWLAQTNEDIIAGIQSQGTIIRYAALWHDQEPTSINITYELSIQEPADMRQEPYPEIIQLEPDQTLFIAQVNSSADVNDKLQQYKTNPDLIYPYSSYLGPETPAYGFKCTIG